MVLRLLIYLLGSQHAAAANDAEEICGYAGTEVVAFEAADGVKVGGYPQRVGFTSINVAQPGSQVSSLDKNSPQCQGGLCPVFVKGSNLELLYPDQVVSTNLDAFCFFGVDLPCASVPIPIRSDELQCSSPTLPERPGIAPFGTTTFTRVVGFSSP